MTDPTAVLFHRLGPYHHARLAAAARRGPIVAVEFSAKDPTYAWDAVTPSGSFPVRTLFPEAQIGSQRVGRVRQRLWKVLDDVGPAGVAVPGWSAPTALLALEWCLRRGVPAVLLSDSQEADAERSRVLEFLKRRIVRLFAAGFVAGTAHRRYLEKLGMPRDRIFDGYDVVDNEHFARGADRARASGPELRRTLGLPERYFLASSRFVPKKNLERLVEAYSRYRRASGSVAWKLVLLGDGELRPDLMRQRERLGLIEDVLLPGFKQYDELPTYLGLAQAFVHASTVEQWGLVVNEAMAAGLPVLVSKACGSAPDLVRTGSNGYTFEPHDTAELAAHMQALSEHQEVSALGRSSREIIARWAPERFAEGLGAAVAAARLRPVPRANPLDFLQLRGLAIR